MTVKLYYNYSDGNHLNKNIKEIGDYSGSLRDSCSVIDPVIMIEAGNLANCNYMYVPEFGRYYYINSITSVRTGLWALGGHVDVLMSYKEGVRNQYAIIARQQYRYNLYLDDDKFLVNAQRKYFVTEFPNRAPEGGSFILTVAGGPQS